MMSSGGYLKRASCQWTEQGGKPQFRIVAGAALHNVQWQVIIRFNPLHKVCTEKKNTQINKRSSKMAKKEIYADGIGQIHFAGGMVRFDFVTLQPEADGAAPVPEVNERIIMPPQGFLGAFNSMQQLIDKLLEAGVLQKNEQAK